MHWQKIQKAAEPAQAGLSHRKLCPLLKRNRRMPSLSLGVASQGQSAARLELGTKADPALIPLQNTNERNIGRVPLSVRQRKIYGKRYVGGPAEAIQSARRQVN